MVFQHIYINLSDTVQCTDIRIGLALHFLAGNQMLSSVGFSARHLSKSTDLLGAACMTILKFYKIIKIQNSLLCKL